jgi:hypothetical protein
MALRHFARNLITTWAVALAAVVALSAAGSAQTLIKEFNKWEAYSYKDNNGKICYVLSRPTGKSPNDRDHGDVFFLVSQKPGQNISYEPQVEVGYPFQDESDVVIKVGGQSFNMFTKGNNAWMKNAAEEPALVGAMRAGSDMKVEGKSRRGTATSYDFSLSGITAALNEIKDCK